MKELELEIRKGGFLYKQMLRTDNVALYSQWDGGRIVCYEVFRIKIQKERKWKSKTFPRKEVYPRNDDFGYSAWAPSSYERAESIYNRLVLEAYRDDLTEDRCIVLKMGENTTKDKASEDTGNLKQAS